jgi:hypothetical protein
MGQTRWMTYEHIILYLLKPEKDISFFHWLFWKKKNFFFPLTSKWERAKEEIFYWMLDLWNDDWFKWIYTCLEKKIYSVVSCGEIIKETYNIWNIYIFKSLIYHLIISFKKKSFCSHLDFLLCRYYLSLSKHLSYECLC